MADGHPLAKKYPIAMLRYEAYLARSRQNNVLATQAVLMDAVVCKAMSPKGKNQAGKQLKKLLRELQSG